MSINHPGKRHRPSPSQSRQCLRKIQHHCKYCYGRINELSRQMGAFFATYDLWLTPTMAVPPVELGVFDATAEMTGVEWIKYILDYCPFTAPFNATGQPGISVPLHQSSDGLPVGMHFVGRLGDEATLLQVASQLEEAAPWADRRPGVFVSD